MPGRRRDPGTEIMSPPRLIGMVHLLPLPASPGYRGSFDEIIDRALFDASALHKAGFDALLAENYGDLPFLKDDAGAPVAAAMTRVLTELRRACPLPAGVQVLRNDARAAMSAAAAAGAEFIRVNVHTGAMFTDQGLIEGRAGETLRLRAELRAEVRIFADVLVKHATPPGGVTLEQAAADTVLRGLADAVIVTGTATGSPVETDDLRRVRSAVSVFLYAGSGVTTATVGKILSIADGVIAGTAIKTEGRTSAPVDERRAAEFVLAASAARA